MEPGPTYLGALTGLLFDRFDHGTEVLHLQNRSTRPPHMLESRTQVLNCSGTVLIPESAQCSLKSNGAEVNELSVSVIAHGGMIARPALAANQTRRPRSQPPHSICFTAPDS